MNTTNTVLRYENEVLRGPHVNVDRCALDDGKTKNQNDMHEKSKDEEMPKPIDAVDGFTRFILQVVASTIGLCTGHYLYQWRNAQDSQ